MLLSKWYTRFHFKGKAPGKKMSIPSYSTEPVTRFTGSKP
ncbi:hypothetical protein HMPREF3226_00604 [Prevotella corporis]|uniref:Uncharacterized protein n=1 Tax=Prevotella corporis TaxID=28128 RepID=A0A133QJA1_9BACT|nr:hypothetical protein HMPREF3226_00604 [Prevotella corporis]